MNKFIEVPENEVEESIEIVDLQLAKRQQLWKCISRIKLA